MLTVRDLLRIKGDGIWAVSPETTTLNALRFMADKNVGALLILEDGILRGIVSERDFVRRIAEERACQMDRPISDYMTTKVITVRLEDTIQDCMQVMTDRHIRHLPVVDGDRLVGLISNRDVVKALISEQSGMIRDMENYITGGRLGQ